MDYKAFKKELSQIDPDEALKTFVDNYMDASLEAQIMYIEQFQDVIFDQKYDPGYKKANTSNILHHAVNNESLDLVQYIFETFPAARASMINEAGVRKTQSTPLHLAVSIGNVCLVSYLLKTPGIKVSPSIGINPSPLAGAIGKYEEDTNNRSIIDIILLLLNAGADPNDTDPSGDWLFKNILERGEGVDFKLLTLLYHYGGRIPEDIEEFTPVAQRWYKKKDIDEFEYPEEEEVEEDEEDDEL